MKKTISITLGGRIFAIEEDGYGVLEQYLNGLKRHFTGDPSSDELMADIESSIGEKFEEKLGPHKQAVTLEDVNGVILVMGKIEEIADEESRDDKKGSKTDDANTSKRFYRNPDDMVIGGVCSGIAAYFGIDPLIVRIIFAILTLVNGFGILVYLVLWMAMPLAETSTQKLEMRGKPLNVEEIEELIKERAEGVGREGREAWQRAQKPDSVMRRILNVPVRIVGAIATGLRTFFRMLGPVLGVLIGLPILISAIAGLVATNVTATLLLFRINSPYIISDLPLAELAGQPMYYVGVVAGYFLVLIPFIFLATLGISIVRRRSCFGAVSSGMWIAIWIVAAGAGAVAASDVAPWVHTRSQEMERQATVSRTIEQRDFTSIALSDSINVTITRGDDYALSFTGLQKDMDALHFTNEKGVLKITQRDERIGPCVFCFRHRVEGEITLPRLVSYTGSDESHGSINGFTEDLVLALNDVAQLDLEMLGQNATATTRDVSRLMLTGSSTRLVLDTSDASRIIAEGFVSTFIRVTGRDVSRTVLEGSTHELLVDLKDVARVDADDLTSDLVTFSTRDVSHYEGPQPTHLETEYETD
ncbi:MAG: PspC domain-containing protein [Patescibacteria group bacterium]|jgi:phage shock protein PspC (stress-responsive transcriptional regulator)